MNNKNFKERAETMKDLFLAGIPSDIICEVVQLSESTIKEDRKRVAKYYGIELPKPISPYLIERNDFRFFFKIYLKARIRRDYGDPLYKAAGIIINISCIEDHINSLQSFYEALTHPHFSVTTPTPIEKNNMNLIEKLLNNYTQGSFIKYHETNFQDEFFTNMYYGGIPYEDFNKVSDVKEAATMYFAKTKLSTINTLIIENPQALLLPFLSVLNEKERKIFVERYGLNSEFQKNLVDIANELGITKTSADNTCRKAYLKVYRELEEVDFYPFNSSGKTKYFERKYNNIKELRTRKYKVTKKVAEKVTNKKQFTKNLDWIEKAAEYPTHSARVTFLTQRIKDAQMPRCLTYKLKGCKYIIDIVENWDSLDFDDCTSEAMDKFLNENRVDRKRVTENDILLSRRIIQNSEKK